MIRFLKWLFTSTPSNGWWVCPHPHGYQLYRGSVPHEPFETTVSEEYVQAIADERNAKENHNG